MDQEAETVGIAIELEFGLRGVHEELGEVRVFVLGHQTSFHVVVIISVLDVNYIRIRGCSQGRLLSAVLFTRYMLKELAFGVFNDVFDLDNALACLEGFIPDLVVLELLLGDLLGGVVSGLHVDILGLISEHLIVCIGDYNWSY